MHKENSMQEVTPEIAFEQIKSGQAVGIDVREIDEWDAGHADGVISNPMSAFDMNLLPEDKPVIFICRSGGRSSQVTMAIEPHKNNVFNMSGGMKAWQIAGLPMVSASGSPEVI